MTLPSEPRRQTPTERLHEVTMQAISRAPSQPESSVTISRNARGVYQFEVTIRDTSVQHAAKEAQRLCDYFSAAYPYPDTPTNGDK